MKIITKAPLTLLLVITMTGCSSLVGSIASCSFEVQKLLLPWFRPDGTVLNVNTYNLREAELLHDCVASKGWYFNNTRANAEYQAGRSLGLVGQYKEPANWSWGWFGLAADAKSDTQSTTLTKP